MASFLGIPFEMIYLMVFVLLVVAYMYWKNAIEDVPEKMLLIRTSALSSLLDAKREIGGVFVKAKKFNKEIFTVTSKCPPIDVHLGGKKFMRLHMLIEGMGETLNIIGLGQKQERDEEGQETAAHEMLGAFKAALNMIADKAQGGVKKHIMGFIAGFGIGGILIMAAERIFGSL